MRRALALLALALLAACGSLSRARFADSDLHDARTPEALTEQRGANPLLVDVWIASATSQTSPQAAMDIVLRGLTFHPGEGNLVLMRISLLAHMGDRKEQIAAAQAALGDDPPSNLEVELRNFLVDGRLALDDVFAARDEVLCLGGAGAEPEMVSSAWAATALAFEFLGHPADADAALDASLDLGPRGVGTLREICAVAPERAAAAHQLVVRARERHPDQPDLQQFLIVDLMVARDYTGAEQALDNLPQPLPDRMRPDILALRARLDLMQGRTEQGLALLREELDRSPGATGALAVMLESWRTNHQPDDAEMLDRLRRARGRIQDEGFARQVEMMLQRVDKGATLSASMNAPAPAPAAPPKP